MGVYGHYTFSELKAVPTAVHYLKGASVSAAHNELHCARWLLLLHLVSFTAIT